MVNLYHLRYFVAAADAGSVAVAARKNGVSPSAVSQAIRALEVAFGFGLLTHERNVFCLTPEARALLGTCRGLLSAAETLEAAAVELGRGDGSDLRIACTNSVAATLLPGWLNELGARHPEVHWRLQLGNSKTITRWLLADEADIGIMVDDPSAGEGLLKQTISHGHYVLFARDGLNSVPSSFELVVTRRERVEVSYFLRELQSQWGAVPSVVREIVNWETMKKYVAAQHNPTFGICPEYVLGAGAEGERYRLVPTTFPCPDYRLIAATASTHGWGRVKRSFLETIAANKGRQTEGLRP